MREEMTVHQALCELKVLRKRITKAIADTEPIATKEAASQKVNGLPIEDFKSNAKAAHASAVDLIRRESAIKAALNQYNASKRITVCGHEYSVAQAIWLMQYGLEDKRTLLERYTTLLTKAKSKIEKANGDDLTRRAESFTVSMFGAKDKANPADFNATLEDYKAKHTLELVDPLGIARVIADLEKEISDFESSVDAAIQVANATTTIEIEY